jgi:hypothetical protein
MEVKKTLTFYSVLNHSDVGKTFCNYLKKENKEETWKFIVSSQLLEILVQKSNKKRATKQIKQTLTFFDKNNKKMLETTETQNLFSSILEKKKTQNLDQLYPLIIDLKNLLLPIYKNIEFKNFQSTLVAKKLCETYSTNKQLVLDLSKEEGMNDSDFERHLLQKKDFEYLNKLLSEEEKDWVHVNSIENMKIFLSFQHYLHNVKFLELPVIVRSQGFHDGNLQEAVAAIFDKLLENDSTCVFFKVIDYQPNQFIADQYLRRPPGETRVRRLVCTIKYENDSLIAISKPLKIPEMEFLKYQNMKFFRNGEEQIERGVQEFFYSGLKFTRINDYQCKFETITIIDGRFGISGVPQARVNLKISEGYKQMHANFKKTKGKKIVDFKEQFNEMKHGLPSNPFAKMLYDLNLDQYEPQKKENKVIDNILGNIQIPSILNQENSKESFSIESLIVKTLNQKKETEGELKITNSLKDDIPPDVLEGELMENITKHIEITKEDQNENVEDYSEMNLAFSDDCLSEIFDFDSNFLDGFEFDDELNLVFD